MPTVTVPPPYRGPTEGRASIQVTAQTVRQCMEAVEACHAGFLTQIFDESGAQRRFVKLFVNGEPAGPEDPVNEADEVAVLAAIAGG